MDLQKKMTGINTNENEAVKTHIEEGEEEEEHKMIKVKNKKRKILENKKEIKKRKE